jgi:heptosyltransferase-2
MNIPDCKHFNGYKPCFADSDCLAECRDPHPRGTRILIVNLEAMGNVLVTTSLLQPIKRKYPQSSICWLTLKNAAPLLMNNPLIDKVYLWQPEVWLALQAMTFDAVMCIDKSVQAGAFIKTLNAKEKLGYGVDENGVIIPLNPEAEYNYRLGLDDHLKFRVNQKANSQLLAEAMGLNFQRDEYILNLSEEEERIARARKEEFGLDKKKLVVGLNTGCSLLYKNKKMTVEQHLVLIDRLKKNPHLGIVLLGGPEDTERNAEIARRAGGAAVHTPTTEGLRRGICYEQMCDLIVTGDSLGMHIAIGLKKQIIVWFGVSCPQEIDLFDRGIKLIPEGLACSPCWKKECPYNLECMQMTDLEKIVTEIESRVNSR